MGKKIKAKVKKGKVTSKPDNKQKVRTLKMASEVLNDKKRGFVVVLEVKDDGRLDGPMYINKVNTMMILDSFGNVLNKLLS